MQVDNLRRLMGVVHGYRSTEIVVATTRLVRLAKPLTRSLAVFPSLGLAGLACFRCFERGQA
jgi:hypothetical protein